MRRRGTPVSREALYEEVWTDAVTVVAPRYGLSDVDLVKICKKLGIPVPPRGYWAKVKAGRPTRKVPLPALPAGARDPSGPIPLSEQEAAVHARVRDALQQTRESQASISVPVELVDPHPLVRAAAARLKRRDGWDHPAGVRSAPKEVLDLQVTRSTLDRALLLMDTLLKSLEPSGFTAQVDEEKGQTLLVGGGTTLTISIVEQVTRTGHTPTRTEVRARDRYCDSFRVGARGEYPNIPQFDWHPTGRLTLTGSWPSRKWNDTERSLIDSRLSGIVAAIVGLAERNVRRKRKRSAASGPTRTRAPDTKRRCTRATKNVASCAPSFATRAGCSAQTACASSSPPSRTEHAATAVSRPRRNTGSSGPEPRPTGSIRSFDEAIQSWMRRSPRLRVTGNTEPAPISDPPAAPFPELWPGRGQRLLLHRNPVRRYPSSRRIPIPPGAELLDHRHLSVHESTSRRNRVETRDIWTHGVQFDASPHFPGTSGQVVGNSEPARINVAPVEHPGLDW